MYRGRLLSSVPSKQSELTCSPSPLAVSPDRPLTRPTRQSPPKVQRLTQALSASSSCSAMILFTRFHLPSPGVIPSPCWSGGEVRRAYSRRIRIAGLGGIRCEWGGRLCDWSSNLPSVPTSPSLTLPAQRAQTPSLRLLQRRPIPPLSPSQLVPVDWRFVIPLHPRARGAAPHTLVVFHSEQPDGFRLRLQWRTG